MASLPILRARFAIWGTPISRLRTSSACAITESPPNSSRESGKRASTTYRRRNSSECAITASLLNIFRSSAQVGFRTSPLNRSSDCAITELTDEGGTGHERIESVFAQRHCRDDWADDSYDSAPLRII